MSPLPLWSTTFCTSSQEKILTEKVGLLHSAAIWTASSLATKDAGILAQDIAIPAVWRRRTTVYCALIKVLSYEQKIQLHRKRS